MTKESTVEELVKRLNEIAVKLESDEIGLADAVSLYEEAQAIGQEVQTKLDKVAERLKVVNK